MKFSICLVLTVMGGAIAGCLDEGFGEDPNALGERSAALASRGELTLRDDGGRAGEDACEGQTWPYYSEACIKQITIEVCEAAGGTGCADGDTNDDDDILYDPEDDLLPPPKPVGDARDPALTAR